MVGEVSHESEPVFRRGVSALVLNAQNQLLLVNLESFANHYYAVPGGGVEGGESLEEAAYRELEEELGIAKSSLQLVSVHAEPVRFTFKEIKLDRDGVVYAGSERYFFGFHYTGDDREVVPKEGEVRSCAWVALADLNQYLLFDNQLQETTAELAKVFPGM